MITAITFDFWLTLYQSANIDYTERLQHLKAQVEAGADSTFTLEAFQAAVNVARDTWNHVWEVEHRTLGASEWLGLMLDELNVELKPEQRQAIETDMENSVLNHPPTLLPEARSTLAELANRYRLAIISDTGLTPGRVLRQIMEADGILQYFTHLTFSDELGYSKPHPNNFLSTLQALDAEPHQAIHIGDLLRTDVAGAQGIGMRAVQYVGVRTDESPIDIVPDGVVVSHTELFSYLDGWSS